MKMSKPGKDEPEVVEAEQQLPVRQNAIIVQVDELKLEFGEPMPLLLIDQLFDARFTARYQVDVPQSQRAERKRYRAVYKQQQQHELGYN